MTALTYNFAMEDPTLTKASETITTTTSTDTFVPSDSRKPVGNREGKWGVNASASIFTPMSTQYQNRGGGSDLLNMFSQREPRTGDTAPNLPEVDVMNFRMNSTEALYNDVEQGSTNNFFLGSNRTESVASHGNMWGESTGVPATGIDDMDTFDFLVKSLASANNFVSMLTREQLSVLRSMRPSLLYEFLQEVARVRGEKRMRRALPNECAFCKNNGENEECYSMHTLKDWRGRVECPVLRAFRCPRCGATGDWAHTIKYCPINGEAGSERGLHGNRRGMWTGNNLNVNVNSRMRGQPFPTPSTPVSSPAPATASLTNAWSSFGIN